MELSIEQQFTLTKLKREIDLMDPDLLRELYKNHIRQTMLQQNHLKKLIGEQILRSPLK